MEGRKECGAAQINLTDLADPPPHEVLSQDPGFFQDRGNTCKRGETEWKNYPSGLFSLDTRDKRFPPLPYCYFCVIPPRVSAVSTFNQLSSCYLRSTERRFTSRTFLFKLRYRGLQGITGREEGIACFSFLFFFLFLFRALQQGYTRSRR